MFKTEKSADSKPAKWTVGSLAAVADFAGVSPRTAAEWKAKGMPGSNGNYNMSTIFRWVRLHVEPPHADQKAAKATRRSAAGVGDDPETIESLERRKLKTQCEMADLRLGRQRGELVLRRAVVAEVEQLIVGAKTRLESIPEEMGSSLPPDIRAETVAGWVHSVNQILREMASFDLQEGKHTTKSPASKAARARRPKKKSADRVV